MNIPSLIEALYGALQSLWRLIHRHGQRAFNLATLALVFAVLWGGWFSLGQQQVVLFVGPPGSSTARIGQDLVERFAATRNANGVNYRVSLEPTAGTFSIRERMGLESTRIPLGFIEDGQANGPHSNTLRALLPMDWDYLFVLCRRGWLKDNSITQVQTLLNIIPKLATSRSGRIFIGPEKSGTAEMARLVLDKFADVREEQFSKGIGDWREMRMALKADEIDLAFYSGPLGAETLAEAANDGKCVLLGLGPITAAIEQETGAKYLASQLPPNLALAEAPPAPAPASRPAASPDAGGRLAELPASEAAAHIPFCQPGLQTIASRRVLACPVTLAAGDAYPLGMAATELLRNKGYEINLRADDLPYGSTRAGGISLRMQPHEALVLMQKKSAPFVWRQVTTWPSWLQSIAALLAGLAGLDLLRMLARRLDAATNGDPEAAAEETSRLPLETTNGSAYQSLLTQLDLAESEIDEKTHLDVAADLPRWHERLRVLKRDIRTADLTDSQRELLLKRAATLRFEVNSSLQWTPQPKPKITSKPRSAPPGSPSLTTAEPAPPAE
jgi:hypothetical protein